MMSVRWIHAASAAPLLLVLVLAACSSSRARLPLQAYVPTARAMMPLGQLQLSNTHLQFEHLETQMKLEYVGIMPESAGPDMAGASVYRVKNADAFFKQNAGKEAFCSEVPRWVVVNSSTGAPAWSTEIWVGLLTLQDWETFRDGADRACTGGNYVRTAQ